MTTGRRSPKDGPGADEIAHLLRALPDILQTPPGQPTADRVLAELANVQIAQEELRVAEEKMRVQQEQITHLLLQHDTESRWRVHMSALMPVGLCVTDGNGTLVDANPALATQLGVPLQWLRGKPLSVFLDPENVPAFRSGLRALAAGTVTEHRQRATIRPRHRDSDRASLFGFPEVSDHRPSIARIQWVLVPDSATPVRPEALDTTSAAAAPGPAEDVVEDAIPTSEVISLATSLAELSSLPIGELDQQRLLSRMAKLVRDAVPAGEWVSITLGDPAEPQRLGSDSTEAQEFDGRQVRAAEGPCWEAYTSRSVVITGDVTADPRWPALARVAGDSAVRSVLALPVRDAGTTIGAVNVYSGRQNAFGPAGRRIGELAAAAVAGVLQNVAERESMKALAANLERALTSRAVIDQAKGMVMARLGVDADDAFARLVSLSSRLNVKVRDLAALIIEGQVDAVLRAD